MNNHPLNKWNKYVKMKVKNDLYIIKPQFTEVKLENKKISYQWERNTTMVKRGNIINGDYENKNQSQNKNEYQNEHNKAKGKSKELVYLDRMEKESKYKSVYVDIDQNTGRVFLKEMTINEEKRKLELEKRQYNIEKLVKFKKINGNICRIKINYVDSPGPWYKDKKALWFHNIFRTGYEGRGRPDFIDLPLSADDTITLFDPDRFNFKTQQEKIEAGLKVKEALTDYNGVGSIKYIIDDNLKNDEYTSKQIKKNMKKE